MNNISDLLLKFKVLHRNMVWSNLYLFSQLWIVNVANLATIVVPLIASVTLFLDKKIQAISINISQEFVILYLAGLLAVIAKVLTEIYCPPMFKDYKSMDDFSHDIWKAEKKALRTVAEQENHSADNVAWLQDLLESNKCDTYTRSKLEWDNINKTDRTTIRIIIGYLYLGSAFFATLYYFIILPIKVFYASG